MARELHLLLPLTRAALARKDAVSRLLARVGCTPAERSALHSVFDFKDAELAFARAVTARTELKLWRVNQRAYGGDFVLVDVSSPALERRPLLALDLKRGRPVRLDRPGIQMRDAARLAALLGRTGVIAPGVAPLCVTGDAHALLGSLGAMLACARVLTWARSNSTRAAPLPSPWLRGHAPRAR